MFRRELAAAGAPSVRSAGSPSPAAPPARARAPSTTRCCPTRSALPAPARSLVAGSTFTVQQTSSNFQCGYSVSSGDLGVAASGGTVVLSIHTDPGCAWSVSGLPCWLTVSGSLSGNRLGQCQSDGRQQPRWSASGLHPNRRSLRANPPVRLLRLRGVRLLRRRALPHLAAGGEWTTSLFAVSSGTTVGNFSVSFYGDDGSSMALPFTGEGNLSALSDSVPAQGRKDYEAGNASLPLQAGWGLLFADHPLQRKQPSAGRRRVAVSTRLRCPRVKATPGSLFPSIQARFLQRGAAVHRLCDSNLNPIAAAHVTCTARDQWGTVFRTR